MRKARRERDGCLRLFEELIAGAKKVSREKQLMDRDAQSPKTDPSRVMKSTVKVHGAKEVQLEPLSMLQQGKGKWKPAGQAESN